MYGVRLGWGEGAEASSGGSGGRQASAVVGDGDGIATVVTSALFMAIHAPQIGLAAGPLAVLLRSGALLCVVRLRMRSAKRRPRRPIQVEGPDVPPAQPGSGDDDGLVTTSIPPWPC